MSQKGNVFIFLLFFIVAILLVFLWMGAVYMSQIDSLLYHFKLDLYSFNKSAILSVNKGITSREKFSYQPEEYRNHFEEMLKTNYHLNEELENENGLIQRVEIMEYRICMENQKDPYTKKKSENTRIHSVIKVKVKPIFLAEMLKNVFTFEMHEDVNLNLLET